MAPLTTALLALSLGAFAAGEEMSGCMYLMRQLGSNGCINSTSGPSPCDEPCFGIFYNMSKVCTNETATDDDGKPFLLQEKSGDEIAMCGANDGLDCMGLFNKFEMACTGDSPACDGMCGEMLDAMSQNCTIETHTFEDGSEKLIKEQATQFLKFCRDPCLSSFLSLSTSQDCMGNSEAMFCADQCKDKLDFMAQNCTTQSVDMDDGMRGNGTKLVVDLVTELLSMCEPCAQAFLAAKNRGCFNPDSSHECDWCSQHVDVMLENCQSALFANQSISAIASSMKNAIDYNCQSMRPKCVKIPKEVADRVGARPCPQQRL
mmetsp:Transcript_98822/g.250818  ORF Transcript_98822/g.250818 Transcript_98822/m.250818 type:complete len:318 (+) Transcript_98822:122-1075(+)